MRLPLDDISPEIQRHPLFKALAEISVIALSAAKIDNYESKQKYLEEILKIACEACGEDSEEIKNGDHYREFSSSEEFALSKVIKQSATNFIDRIDEIVANEMIRAGCEPFYGRHYENESGNCVMRYSYTFKGVIHQLALILLQEAYDKLKNNHIENTNEINKIIDWIKGEIINQLSMNNS